MRACRGWQPHRPVAGAAAPLDSRPNCSRKLQQMPVIDDSVDRQSPDFAANRTALLDQVAELRRRVAVAAIGGSEVARARHTSRGKLLPRDRIGLLLDHGSPFLEVAPLAAHGMYGGEVP